MTPLVWSLLAIALTLSILTWIKWVVPLWRRLKAYAELCSTCGYLPPPPTPRALRFLRGLSRVLLFLQVGKVKIVGAENLDVPGPRIITPNHGHSVDPAPFALLLKEPARYMAARGVFKFGGGLGSLIAGPCGAFCADLTPGKGSGAIDAAVKAVTTGQTLVMFPEGWAYMDGSLGPFKKGAVRIARRAQQQLNEAVNIFPVYMRYGAHPGAVIKKLPPPLQYLLVLLAFPLYRRGLTVCIGKPLKSTELPGDDELATEYLRQLVIALDPGPRKG